MIVLLWSLACATPWGFADLEPLVACDGQDGPQLSLLEGIRGLRFDTEGRLWIADLGSLTVRDRGGLAVVEQPAPGVNGWNRWSRPSTQKWAAVSPVGLAIGFDGPVSRVNLRGQLRPEPCPECQMRTARWEGWHAWSDDRRLYLVGPEREEQTLEVVSDVDSIGILHDRLFTVDHGRLRVWSGDGRAHWQAEGTWGAVAVRDTKTLVGLDPTGRLHRIQAKGTRPGLCVIGDCSERVEPALPAPDGQTPEDYRARVREWREAHTAFLESAPRGHIAVSDAHIVVAELDASLRARVGRVITSLVVLDAKGKRVRGRIEVEEPHTLAPLQLWGDVAVIGDRAWSLESLEPMPRPIPPNGVALRILPNEDETEDALIGAWTDDGFRPAAGLGPRLAPQQRVGTHGGVFGDRFVLANAGGQGPAEVWCVPPVEAQPRTLAPGLIATGRSKRTGWFAPQNQGRRSPWRGVLKEGFSERFVLWADPHLATVPPVPKGWDLWVRSNQPRPEDLPANARWEILEFPAGDATRDHATVSYVVNGVRVWDTAAGPPGGLP